MYLNQLKDIMKKFGYEYYPLSDIDKNTFFKKMGDYEVAIDIDKQNYSAHGTLCSTTYFYESLEKVVRLEKAFTLMLKEVADVQKEINLAKEDNPVC